MNYSKKIIIIVYFFMASLSLDFVVPLINVFSAEKSPSFGGKLHFYLLSNIVIFILAFILVSLIKNIYVLAPLIAISFGIVGYLHSVVHSVGIIKVVWHGMLGAFAGSILFLYPIIIKIEHSLGYAKNTEKQKILSLKDDLWTVLRLVVQVVMAFGVLTGVCMTILFREGFDDSEYILNAIRMVTGMGFCMGGVYFWSIYPSMKVLDKIRERGY